MKRLALLLLMSCQSGPTNVVPPPAPAASVSASAALPDVPPPPVKEIEEKVEVQWEPVKSKEELEKLTGRWVDAVSGDAIPQGPMGGKIVHGGVRVELVEGKPGSKTPFNVTFWAPKDGHTDSNTISGGCGFYTTFVLSPGNGNQWVTDAYCRGYGLPEQKSAHHRAISFWLHEKMLSMKIYGLFDEELSRP